jgi:uncharacterized membrane protein
MKLLLTPRSPLVRKIAFGGIFAALSFVVTFLLQVPLRVFNPLSNGYLNLGDSVAILAGLLSTSIYAPLGAALGAGLSDLALTYVIYSPFTFAIKLMEGLAAGILFRAIAKRVSTSVRPARPGLPTIPALILASLFGGLLMALGYFVAESSFLKLLDPALGLAVAFADLPMNLAQGFVGAFLAIALYPAVSAAAKDE